jgi:glycosyltransferase involved in cell wall biosynthesis
LSRASKEANFDKTDLYCYQEIMERIAVKEADAVIVISEALRNEVISWGIDQEKVTVIPNAVDLNKFSSQNPDLELKRSLGLENCFIVGFLGSLTEYEGLDLLIKAVGNLLDQGKQIGLVIVGDGQVKEQLEAIAQMTSSPNRIIFTGRVPFEDVNKYYSIFDVCPLPRKSYEVCKRVPPLKILEILAMGKPTIVSDLPPLLEIIEDHITGRVCQADSIENLQEVIMELYNHPEKTQRLSQAGRTWVEQNRSWDVISEQILKFYENLSQQSIIIE